MNQTGRCRRFSYLCLFSFLASGINTSGASGEDIGNTTLLSSTFDVVRDGVDLLIPEYVKGDDLRIRLGAGFGFVPDYYGSDNYRFRATPLIDLRYKNRLRLSFNQLSFSVIHRDGFELGPLLRYKSGRSESRNPILAGLGDISATTQVGAFARYRTDRMLLSLELREALGSNQGTQIHAMAGHALFRKGNFVLAAAITGRWLSDSAAQTNFGITQEQANTSLAGLEAFTVGRGLSRVGSHVLLRYDVTENYRLLGLVTYERLLDGFADSPLVAGGAGSANQLRAGIGFTIDF